jgi:hypothetical protein
VKELTTPLFDLPEYRSAFGIFFHKALNALMKAKDPVLNMIKVEEREHIPTHQVTTSTGETVELEAIVSEMGFILNHSDLVNGAFEALILNLDDAADQGLKVLMPKIFEYLGQVCDATGNVVDGRGQPFSFDHVLEALEKVQIDFDEAGNPELPTMVVSPEVFQKLKMNPPTPEQLRKRDEIIERKRGEHNARRRTRQIS